MISSKRNDSRRDFLKISALGFSSLALAPLAGRMLAQSDAPPKSKPDLSKVKRGTLLGTGAQISKETGEKRFVLSIVDLDATVLQPRLVVLDFEAHGYAPDPRDPNKIVLFQKHGAGCAEIDLAEGKVIRKLEASKGAQFYGHGAFSPDGSVLYATESVIEESYRGIISVRDGVTFKLTGEFPTFGAAPHDCALIDNGKTMVVTNGGGTLKGAVPCVTYVSTEKKELIEKLEFGSENINAGHLVVGKKGDLAVSSARREGLPVESLGGLSVRPHGKEFKTLTQPDDVYKKMIGETLSLCFNEDTRVVGATNPYGNIVTFWNIDTGALVRKIEVANPRGLVLTLNNEFFVLSYLKDPVVALVDGKTCEPVKGSKFDNAPISGSHMFMHALPPVA